MIPELSPDLRQAVQHLSGDQPLRVIDPDTNTAYVLVKAEVFDRVQTALNDDESAIAETYAAQSEAALQAGWSEPKMDDYNDYDQHRQRPCS